MERKCDHKKCHQRDGDALHGASGYDGPMYHAQCAVILLAASGKALSIAKEALEKVGDEPCYCAACQSIAEAALKAIADITGEK